MNGKHEDFLRKVKETIRLLFSSEIYDEYVDAAEPKDDPESAPGSTPATDDPCPQE